MVFITANLECTREDCEALVNLLKTLLKRIDMDREVSYLCEGESEERERE